jgi:hypothetical protein
MEHPERHAFLSILGGFFLVTVLALVGPAHAAPSHLDQAPSLEQEQTPDQGQSVTGTIAAVGRHSFTLTLGTTGGVPGESMQQTAPKSMTFMIDKNTTVDGKLKVGASADVTYREDNGSNVAISVRVTS